LSGEEDHVHILFQYHPAMELSKFVNNFKSVTSRKLRQEFREEIKKFYERVTIETPINITAAPVNLGCNPDSPKNWF
jgi:REP element-mobilizing transposase RayT